LADKKLFFRHFERSRLAESLQRCFFLSSRLIRGFVVVNKVLPITDGNRYPSERELGVVVVVVVGGWHQFYDSTIALEAGHFIRYYDLILLFNAKHLG
jgi:hypothetical protein